MTLNDNHMQMMMKKLMKSWQLNLESFFKIGLIHIWLSAGPAMKSYILSEYRTIAQLQFLPCSVLNSGT